MSSRVGASSSRAPLFAHSVLAHALLLDPGAKVDAILYVALGDAGVTFTVDEVLAGRVALVPCVGVRAKPLLRALTPECRQSR